MMSELMQRFPRFSLPIVTPGNNLAAPIIQRVNGVDVLGNTPTSAVTDTLAAIAADGGTGANLPAPDHIPNIGAIFGTTEQQVMNASSVANAGQWESETSALAPNAAILQTLAQSGSGGGVNLQLGPQMDFAPIDTTAGGASSSNSGGAGVFLVLALGIVGALVWYHFRKKKATSGAATA